MQGLLRQSHCKWRNTLGMLACPCIATHCNATNLASVFCERIAAITGLLGCQLRPKVVQRLLVGKPRFAQLLAKHHC